MSLLASRDQVARAYVLHVEVPLVLVAAVSESKVDTRAVLGGGPHQVGHDARNVEGQLPLRPLRHFLKASGLGLRSAAGINHLHTAFLLLFAWRVLDGQPPFWLELPLSFGLQVCPQCEGLHDLPGVPHAARHVHDGLIADYVWKAVDLSEELCLCTVYILSFP